MDCQWLQKLHSYGLLSGSFRPDDQVCVFRSYIRQRDSLTKSTSVHIQRMQKALTQMNVQLHRVVSDITGVTGMAIIRAIVAGERDPQRSALKDARAKRSITEIAAALIGDYRVEHLFVLKQELNLYDMYQQQIQQCDQQIEQCLAEFDSQNNEPLPPRPKGKILSSKTRKVVNRAANAFRIAAQSLANSRTAVGGFYRRIRSRSGAPIAITATAHKLARIFYHLWTTGEDFVDAGVDAYEQQYQQRIVKHLKQRAKQMGFDLVPELVVA